MSIEEPLDRFQVMRRERIKLIANRLREKKEVDLKSFLASISVEYGIRSQTGREYLRDLEAVGKIEISNGQIKWREKTDILTDSISKNS